MFDIFNMLKKDENHPVKQVTRETIIGDILDMDQSTAPYFMEIGMHCLGCPASRGESIEEACEVLLLCKNNERQTQNFIPPSHTSFSHTLQK